jgi:hypothetical protein
VSYFETLVQEELGAIRRLILNEPSREKGAAIFIRRPFVAFQEPRPSFLCVLFDHIGDVPQQTGQIRYQIGRLVRMN